MYVSVYAHRLYCHKLQQRYFIHWRQNWEVAHATAQHHHRITELATRFICRRTWVHWRLCILLLYLPLTSTLLTFWYIVYMTELCQIICPRSPAFLGMLWAHSSQSALEAAGDSVLHVHQERKSSGANCCSQIFRLIHNSFHRFKKTEKFDRLQQFIFV